MRRWWIVGLTSLVLAAAMVTAVVAVVAGFGPAPAHAQQGPNQPVPDRPQMISATGTAEIPAGEGGQANLPMMLNVGVQQQVAGADTQAAVKAVQDKVAAIKSALVGVGVPAGSIQVTSFNMGPASGPPTPPPPPGATAPARPAPASVQGYHVNQNLQVSISSPDQALAALQAAIQAGATSVNTNTPPNRPVPSTPPDARALAPAIKAATEQAKALAQASAESVGLTLGRINGVTIQAPQWLVSGPGSTGSWRVHVMVSYSAASSQSP